MAHTFTSEVEYLFNANGLTRLNTLSSQLEYSITFNYKNDTNTWEGFTAFGTDQIMYRRYSGQQIRQTAYNYITEKWTYDNQRYLTISPQTISDFLYSWLQQNGTFLDNKITLYQNTAERNRVNKTDYLTQIYQSYFTFKDEVSITNPTILLEYNNVPDFNYVYLNKLNRYYYVEDIISVRQNLWEIQLSVDVLMTYKSGIKELQAFVDRNEFHYIDDIIDDRWVAQQGVEIEDIELSNTFFGEVDFGILISAGGVSSDSANSLNGIYELLLSPTLASSPTATIGGNNSAFFTVFNGVDTYKRFQGIYVTDTYIQYIDMFGNEFTAYTTTDGWSSLEGSRNNYYTRRLIFENGAVDVDVENFINNNLVG